LVERVEVRGARSWRRLYADTELELTLADNRGLLNVPTDAPQDLEQVVP
jgi:hypothetical protein